MNKKKIKGSFRVLRGGSWYRDSDYSRVADRDSFSPVFRFYGVSFRVLRRIND